MGKLTSTGKAVNKLAGAVSEAVSPLMGRLASEADEAKALRRQRAYLEDQAALSPDPGIANELMAEAQDVDERLASIGSAPWSVAAVGLGAASQSDDADAGVITKGGKRIIEAFHGSPYKFDRFSMENIGTGEGAQAYGHGLYFADSEDVARQYKDALSAPDWKRFDFFDEKSPEQAKESIGEYFATHLYQENNDSLSSLAGHRPSYLAVYRAGREALESGALDDAIKADFDLFQQGDRSAPNVNRVMEEAQANIGNLYRVHLDVDPDTLLDWDKPLSEQPSVLSALQSYVDRKAAEKGGNVLLTDGFTQSIAEILKVPEEVKGWDLKSTLGDMVASGDIQKNQQEATRVLYEAGIPGIRYLDGNSRGAGEGSYNYVMFDDKPVNIQERGAADPLALIGTAAAGFVAARQQKQGQWDSLREGLMDALGKANAAAEFIFDTAEIPWQGILGLTRTAGGLAAGESLDDALQAGASQVRQPVDQTAYQLGGVATDATGSPAIGTAVNTAVTLGGPI